MTPTDNCVRLATEKVLEDLLRKCHQALSCGAFPDLCHEIEQVVDIPSEKNPRNYGGTD